MKSLYFDILHHGYLKGIDGIILNTIKKDMKIQFPSKEAELNFHIWFYSNFYNYNAEATIVKHTQSGTPALQVSPSNLSKFNNANTTKSYLRGESLSKYIDYLELKDTRKSSKQAKWFSLFSIVIAILAIIVPQCTSKIPTPPYEIIISEKKESIKKKHESIEASSAKIIDSLKNNNPEKTEIY